MKKAPRWCQRERVYPVAEVIDTSPPAGDPRNSKLVKPEIVPRVYPTGSEKVRATAFPSEAEKVDKKRNSNYADYQANCPFIHPLKCEHSNHCPNKTTHPRIRILGRCQFSRYAQTPIRSITHRIGNMTATAWAEDICKRQDTYEAETATKSTLRQTCK